MGGASLLREEAPVMASVNLRVQKNINEEEVNKSNKVPCIG